MIFRERYRKVFLKGIALILGGDRALYRERKVTGFGRRSKREKRRKV